MLLLVLVAGCDPKAKVPPAVQPAAGKTAWGLNGSFRPALTNGQVLTGRVQLVVAPYSKDRWHSITISVDDDEDLTVDAEFPAGATNAVVVEIDTAQFAPGPHTLTLGGEIAVVHDVFTWVRGKTQETDLLPERTWKVTFTASLSAPAAARPSNQAWAAKPAENPDPTNAPPARRGRGNLSNKDLLDKRTEMYRQKSEVAFDKLLAVLKPYGSEPSKVFNTGREISVQYRTNRQGGITIEVGVRSDSHQASFLAGPVDARGEHINPSLPEGPLLTQFASLYDGSDTRRNPAATNTWYRSTGQWSEEEAVTETLRLLAGLGVPRERIVKHKFRASPMTVNNPAGEPVRVTPFYRVDVYDKHDSPDDDPGFIIMEFRMDEKPPGKVTRLSVWPPIKVP